MEFQVDKRRRDFGVISPLNVVNLYFAGEERYVMKLKSLEKRIQRLEKHLREGRKKLAKLKRKLQAKIAAEAKEARRKSRTRRRLKRKLNLSPERRAQLAEAMKARWAAKRAAQASRIRLPSHSRFDFRASLRAGNDQSERRRILISRLALQA